MYFLFLFLYYINDLKIDFAYHRNTSEEIGLVILSFVPHQITNNNSDSYVVPPPSLTNMMWGAFWSCP